MTRTGILAIVLTAAALAAASVGCGDQPVTADAGEANPVSSTRPPNNGKTSPPRVPVRVEPVESSLFVETIEVTGSILPWVEVVVSSELGGLVRQVGFDKGRRVRKGQLLARVGDDLAQARYDQAQAELAGAEARYEQTKELFDRNAVPRQLLIDATAARGRARAVARERELLLERSLIQAPISGVAVSKEIETGEIISPSTTVTTIQRIEKLKVEARVPDTEIGWLAEESSASISVDAFPNQLFEGRISFVAPAADKQTRSFIVEILLDNEDRFLRPGMVARVGLEKRRIESALAIPIDAMITRTEGTVVYVIEDCRARMRSIDPVAMENERALVEEGLALGDQLVVAGQQDLSDGQLVSTESCP